MSTHLSCHSFDIGLSRPRHTNSPALSAFVLIHDRVKICFTLMFTQLSRHPLTSSHPYQDIQTCLTFGICIGTCSCKKFMLHSCFTALVLSSSDIKPSRPEHTNLPALSALVLVHDRVKICLCTHVRPLVLSSGDIKSSRPGHTNLPDFRVSPTCLVIL